MATIAAVRDGLKATIAAAATELNGYDTVPDVVQVPAFVVHPDTCDYQIGMGTCQTWEYSIYVLVPRTETRINQDQLDAYLSTSGAGSIPAALRATPGLGVAGVNASLMSMSGYGGSWESARIPHVGARLHVRVIVTE